MANGLQVVNQRRFSDGLPQRSLPRRSSRTGFGQRRAREESTGRREGGKRDLGVRALRAVPPRWAAGVENETLAYLASSEPRSSGFLLTCPVSLVRRFRPRRSRAQSASWIALGWSLA